MLSLLPGFRLRAATTAQAAADAVRASLRRKGKVMAFLPEAGWVELLQVAPAARAEWKGYVARLADEFPAALAVTCRYEARPARGGIEALRDGHWIPLRWNQVVAVRTWGVGFEGDPLLIDDVERRVYAGALHRLATRARGAGRVFALRAYDPGRLPGLVAEPLERLIHDVLNEEVPVATLATLEEDFLEKTDLRVRYPDLDRRRGARVQVAWAVDEAGFARKVEGMRLREEFAFVTPFTLVRALAELDPAPTAQDVIGHLTYALRRPAADPRGPLAFLPSDWRAAIRATVHADALATTEQLRNREQAVRARKESP